MLFADLFYQRCKALPFDAVDFWQSKQYGIGEFCRNELGYTKKKTALSCLMADAYVLISGGSLGDDWHPTRRSALRRFVRFVLPGRLFQMMGKPVYVLGVGGGPIDSLWLRKQTVKMLNQARVVMFREEETRRYFAEYGVTNDITVTTDTAQMITQDMLPPLKVQEELDQFSGGRKKLYVHLSENDFYNGEICKREIPGVIRFLQAHPEYVCVVSYDNVRMTDPQGSLRKLQAVSMLREQGLDVFLYDYSNTWQLCALLMQMDCVITHKLHIGIVGATLGKSVLSFPVHRSKTQRYYHQVGEESRCIHMKDLSPEIVYEQLETYHAKPVALPAWIRQEAEKNLSILKDISAGTV